MKNQNNRTVRGFTLIELLVVIAIIAILAAILFPVFAQAREKARQTSCLSNQKQIGLGLIQYTQDYDETYPIHGLYDFTNQFGIGVPVNPQGWLRKVQPYMKSVLVTRCPSDGGPKADYGDPDTGGFGPVASYAGNALFFGDNVNGTQLAGVIGLTFNYQPLILTRTLGDVNRPAETIAFAEKHSDQVVKTNYVWLGANTVDVWPLNVFLSDFVATGQGFSNDGAECPNGARAVGAYPLGREGGVATKHAGLGNFAFADGHVKAMKPEATNPDGRNRPEFNMWDSRRK